MVPKITEDTFFISDCHFGHSGAVDFEPSRAEAMEDDEVESQEEMMIRRWNSVVDMEDLVVIAGDFAFKGISEYASKLNGRKILIRGNHDRPKKHAYMQAGFEYVYDTVVAYDYHNWMMDTDDTYMSGIAVTLEGYDPIFISHYPVHYIENEYEKNRRESLAPRIAALSAISDSFGCGISIHGHTHSNMVDDLSNIKYLNISAEALDFTPIRLKALLDASGLRND